MIYEKTLELYPENIEKIENFLKNGKQIKSDKIRYWVHFPDNVSISISCEPVFDHLTVDHSSSHSHIESKVYKDGEQQYTQIRGKNFTEDYTFKLGEDTYIIHIKNKEEQEKHTMKKWTEEELLEKGYEIENAQITSVKLTIEELCCLTLDLVLEGNFGGVIFGGRNLGNCYTGGKPSNKDEDFKGYASGTEVIMRIMSTVGVNNFSDLKDKYVRVVFSGQKCIMIGNIIKDVWFDYDSFYDSIIEEKCDEIKEFLLEEKIKNLITTFSTEENMNNFRTDASGVICILNEILETKEGTK